ncbi:hypothetical protein PR048_003124 [Dryococelus australis]|uniref:Uncharacterized protein n=1 Tax=Dryococelus australis TaxID=614101 RepID=A0ABQ9INH5_9NEOP|nr:hypothetical protein PR048_003124 [Dryococelus australis]
MSRAIMTLKFWCGFFSVAQKSETYRKVTARVYLFVDWTSEPQETRTRVRIGFCVLTKIRCLLDCWLTMKQRRVDACEEISRRFKEKGNCLFARVITRAEICIHYHQPETKGTRKEWRNSPSPKPKKLRMQPSADPSFETIKVQSWRTSSPGGALSSVHNIVITLRIIFDSLSSQSDTCTVAYESSYTVYYVERAEAPLAPVLDGGCRAVFSGLAPGSQPSAVLPHDTSVGRQQPWELIVGESDRRGGGGTLPPSYKCVNARRLCPLHRAIVTTIQDLHFQCVPHPTFSPFLAPSDYHHMFGALKETTEGKKFHSDEEVHHALLSHRCTSTKHVTAYSDVNYWNMPNSKIQDNKKEKSKPDTKQKNETTRRDTNARLAWSGESRYVENARLRSRAKRLIILNTVLVRTNILVDCETIGSNRLMAVWTVTKLTISTLVWSMLKSSFGDHVYSGEFICCAREQRKTSAVVFAVFRLEYCKLHKFWRLASLDAGTAVAERLDCSPYTKANRVHSPPVSESFLGDLPFPPPLHSDSVTFWCDHQQLGLAGDMLACRAARPRLASPVVLATFCRERGRRRDYIRLVQRRLATILIQPPKRHLEGGAPGQWSEIDAVLNRRREGLPATDNETDGPQQYSRQSPISALKTSLLRAVQISSLVNILYNACARVSSTAQPAATSISDGPAVYKLLQNHSARIGKRETGYTETKFFSAWHHAAVSCSRGYLSPRWRHHDLLVFVPGSKILESGFVLLDAPASGISEVAVRRFIAPAVIEKHKPRVAFCFDCVATCRIMAVLFCARGQRDKHEQLLKQPPSNCTFDVSRDFPITNSEQMFDHWNHARPPPPPGRITGFSQVRIVPDDAAGRRVFSGISRIHSPFISAPLHIHFNYPHRLSRPR